MITRHLWIRILPVLFLPSLSWACFWKQHEPPFWSSERIPVCFVPPASELNPEKRQAYEAAMANIKRVFQEQINNRTPFKLSGFAVCDHNPHTQGVRHDLPPAVRITLTEGTARGASGTAAGARFDGPRSGMSSSNIEVDYLSSLGKGSGAFSPADPAQQGGTAVHEFLHLLGIQHEHLRESSKFMEQNAGDGYVERGPVDRDSLMYEGTATTLSAGDVACVQAIADRSILYGSNPQGQGRETRPPSPARR